MTLNDIMVSDACIIDQLTGEVLKFCRQNNLLL